MPLRRDPGAHKTLDRFFYASIWLKGLHAVFEILGGVALLLAIEFGLLRAFAMVLAFDEVGLAVRAVGPGRLAV